MEIKIASASSPSGLTQQIKVLLEDGWKPMGSHSVTNVRSQNRFRGDQHMDTTHESEYSITMTRDSNEQFIKVGVYFYYEDEAETIKVFDEEEMRFEFESELKKLK